MHIKQPVVNTGFLLYKTVYCRAVIWKYGAVDM